MRFAVIAVLVVLMGGLGLYGLGLSKHLSQSGWFDPTSQSSKGSVVADTALGRDHRSDVILLITAPPGTKVTDPQISTKVEKFVDDLLTKYPTSCSAPTTATPPLRRANSRRCGTTSRSSTRSSPRPMPRARPRRTSSDPARSPLISSGRSSVSVSPATTTPRCSTTSRRSSHSSTTSRSATTYRPAPRSNSPACSRSPEPWPAAWTPTSTAPRSSPCHWSR